MRASRQCNVEAGTPVLAAVLTMIPGFIGLATGQLMLFPSLGPTALMQAHHPEHKSSRTFNVIVSHVGGLLSGFLAVVIFGLARSPSVFATHTLSLARVLAAGLAILLGTAIEVIFHAQHPPAAATTLLAALGSFRPTMHDTADVIGGVIIVAIAGNLARRLYYARALDTRPPDI